MFGEGVSYPGAAPYVSASYYVCSDESSSCSTSDFPSDGSASASTSDGSGSASPSAASSPPVGDENASLAPAPPDDAHAAAAFEGLLVSSVLPGCSVLPACSGLLDVVLLASLLFLSPCAPLPMKPSRMKNTPPASTWRIASGSSAASSLLTTPRKPASANCGPSVGSSALIEKSTMRISGSAA